MIDGIAADVSDRALDEAVIGKIERFQFHRHTLTHFNKANVLVLDEGLNRYSAIAAGEIACVRDKIAASKRKGMWMGGPVPLGYDAKDRKLIPNETEAELVNHIMERYINLGSVVGLVDELNRAGHRTKVQPRTNGPARGGGKFSRGMLYRLLTNRVYRGMIVHKGEAFDGEHHAIVPEPLWAKVQAALTERANGGARRLGASSPSLLAGMLSDGGGRAMTPNHSTKSGKRYRYYITRPQELRGKPSWRVSATISRSWCANGL